MGDALGDHYSEPWILSRSFPEAAGLTTVVSADIPGGAHVLMSAEQPGDNSLFQFIFNSGVDLEELSLQFCRAFHEGGHLGLGAFKGTIPCGIESVRMVREPHKTNLYCADAAGVDRFVVSVYRQVWPGIPNEVQLLSILGGPHFPHLLGHLEVEYEGQTYVLSTTRCLPTGINAFEYSQQGAAAQMFSHSQGVDLGQTLRYLHDTLFLAFPHEWRDASTVTERLERRLDRFLQNAPALAEHATWIRDWYRNLKGEVLVQRIHGSMTFRRVWFEDLGTWFIDGWEGDLSLPLQERIVTDSPLNDLATLQRSLSWASLDNRLWGVKAMASIFEGYDEPMMTRLSCAYELDRACEDISNHSGIPGGEPEVVLEFLSWFLEVAAPTRNQMEPSQFHREG